MSGRFSSTAKVLRILISSCCQAPAMDAFDKNTAPHSHCSSPSFIFATKFSPGRISQTSHQASMPLASSASAIARTRSRSTER